MRIPYGYILNGNQLTINEKAADIVSKIFNYYLAGASLQSCGYALCQWNPLSNRES